MDVRIFQPTVLLDEGTTQIAGIKFGIPKVDFAFDIAVPEINIVHPHMLGHDKHALD